MDFLSSGSHPQHVFCWRANWLDTLIVPDNGQQGANAVCSRNTRRIRTQKGFGFARDLQLPDDLAGAPQCKRSCA
jgi:hypothetical protein